MGICPTFINPKEINFTDGAIVDILSRDKSIIHLRKFCAKNKFENMKSCLEGILKNCRPSNIKSVRYLITIVHWDELTNIFSYIQKLLDLKIIYLPNVKNIDKKYMF